MTILMLFLNKNLPELFREKAPAKIEKPINHNDHKNKVKGPGITRDSIQIANANIIQPITRSNVIIQEPALGNNFPAETPINNKGIPIPIPKVNSANAPNKLSPV